MAQIVDLEAWARSSAMGSTYSGIPSSLFVLQKDKLAMEFAWLDFSDKESLIVRTPLSTSSFSNDTGSEESANFFGSKATTAEASVQIDQGITAGINLVIPVMSPDVGSPSQLKTDTNISTLDAQRAAYSQSWNWSVQIPIPARSTVEASAVVQTAKSKWSFKATLRLHGQFLWSYYRKVGNQQQSYAMAWDLGLLFKKYPNPNATVLDDKTIACSVSGSLITQYGINYLVETKEGGPAAETSFKQISLLHQPRPWSERKELHR